MGRVDWSDVGVFALGVTVLVYASLMLAALITAARRGQWGWVPTVFQSSPLTKSVSEPTPARLIHQVETAETLMAASPSLPP